LYDRTLASNSLIVIAIYFIAFFSYTYSY